MFILHFTHLFIFLDSHNGIFSVILKVYHVYLVMTNIELKTENPLCYLKINLCPPKNPWFMKV